MSSEKIGVYLCRCGGNIGDVIDVGAIADEVSGMDGVRARMFRIISVAVRDRARSRATSRKG